jgi:hypothetical protein
MLIDSGNEDIVHHLILNECDVTTAFDDNNLPYGGCDENADVYLLCATNIAMAWAVGGDLVSIRIYICQSAMSNFILEFDILH